MLHESTTLNYDLHAAELLSKSLQTGRTRVVLDCPYTYHQGDYKTTARGFFTVPLNGAEVADKGDQENLQEHSDGSARVVCTGDGTLLSDLGDKVDAPYVTYHRYSGTAEHCEHGYAHLPSDIATYLLQTHTTLVLCTITRTGSFISQS